MPKENDLSELVARLREAAGDNLQSVVLYGSAADHEFHEAHSDLNILCLLRSVSGVELGKIQPVGLWWWRKGHPSPLVFTLEELRHSADVFAVELLDMKRQHRMLWGDDFFAQFDVPMELHRLQVERELRINVARLRQSFLRSRGRRADLTELMVASASTFSALFRHSLLSLGETPPESRRESADRLAAVIGFNAAAFHTVLDLREGKRGAGELNPERVFGDYLDAVAKVAEEMDRRLAKA
jgi:hypothetical protein